MENVVKGYVIKVDGKEDKVVDELNATTRRLLDICPDITVTEIYNKK